MLCCRASNSIASVGNDTLIWLPAVKKGFTSCRSGVIMIMCCDSTLTSGIVSRSFSRM
jgi:hypothetical protein